MLNLTKWNEQSCLFKRTFQTEIGVFQDDLRLTWKKQFLRKMLFHKFLMENVGDLVCTYLYVFWATHILWGSASFLNCHLNFFCKFFINLTLRLLANVTRLTSPRLMSTVSELPYSVTCRMTSAWMRVLYTDHLSTLSIERVNSVQYILPLASTRWQH